MINQQTPEEKAQGLKNKGNKYFKATHYEQAIKCYNEAIEIAPTSKPKDLSTFYQNRAAAHEQLVSDFVTRMIYYITVKTCFKSIKGSRILNSWWGGRAPLTFVTGNFCCLYTRKREARKKGKLDRKRKKIVVGMVGNLKWKGKKAKNEQRDFFFFFFYFAFHFLKPLKLVWVYHNWKIYRENAYSCRENLGIVILPPLKIIPLTPLVKRLNFFNKTRM